MIDEKAAAVVDLSWWKLPYPGGKDALRKEVEKILTAEEQDAEENDVDFCSECECIVPEGGKHDKKMHFALPKGTMLYETISDK